MVFNQVVTIHDSLRIPVIGPFTSYHKTADLYFLRFVPGDAKHFPCVFMPTRP